MHSIINLQRFFGRIFLILFVGFFFSIFHTFHSFAAPATSTNIQIAPDPQPGIFTPAPCWTAIPPQALSYVSCGYVSVPERHANPDGPKIQLAVMIIRATAPDAQPDPLFLLQGGPGGSTIDTYAEILLTTRPLLNNRDIVLFDQRGTLNSQPSLICTEYDELLLETIELDLSDEEYFGMEKAASLSCRQRLTDQGIDIGAYNSLENAADIQAIRQALNYEQINLYGVSYGTLLALHTMRFYPQNLRSVILDAVVPPQTNFILEVPQTAQRAFTQLFTACEQNPECSKSYPNLETRFYQLIESLNQSPALVPLTDPDSGITYQAVIDGDTFLDGIFQLLYIGDLIPAIPKTIVDAEDGRFDFFARILSILVFDRTYSYGMYYSVLCSEDVDFLPEDIDLGGVHPQLAEAQKDGPTQFLQTCEIWDVNELEPVMDEPVQSQLPVLILSGEFDPITPPAFGRAVAERLPNSFVVEFPTGGHGAALDGDCQDQIIRSFLDQPEQSPDSSCVEPVETLEFFTPQSLVEIPAFIQLLNLQNSRPIEFLILLSAALFIFPGIFIIPLRWLWREYRFVTHKDNPSGSSQAEILSPADPGQLASQITPSETRSKLATAGWFVSSPTRLFWFFSIITWLFLISLFTILGLLLANNDNRLFFGIPGQARFLFSMPILMLLTFLLLSLAMIKNWFRKDRKIFSKIGITLGWIACLVVLLILQRWEILFALF